MISLDTLLGKQNRDGGWPYTHGCSWAEPTVFAILVSDGSGRTDAADRGLAWLRSLQRADGGFPPQAAVEESTWVTSLVALLPPGRIGAAAHARSLEWLLRSTGKESSAIHRIRQFMLGRSQPKEQSFHGWPWFPGAAAWVVPTAFALLALRKQQQFAATAELAQRLDLGRQFLLARMCREGGWNHGAAQALGYDARPYPETTGVALLALAGARSAAVDRALEAALRFLDNSRSADAVNWLRLGLLAHGRLPAGYVSPDLPCRTVRDGWVALLAGMASAGPNPFT